ncbi:hypothetical protein DV515_00018644, partial [Chloebia gouldiae]
MLSGTTGGTSRIQDQPGCLGVCDGRKAHSVSHSGRHRAPPKHPKMNLKSLSPPCPASRQE